MNVAREYMHEDIVSIKENIRCITSANGMQGNASYQTHPSITWEKLWTDKGVYIYIHIWEYLRLDSLNL